MLKAITSIFFLLFLNGCAQIFVFLGPAITGASTGSMYQAGLSYGSSTAITKITGKSSLENIITFLDPTKTTEDDSDTGNIKTFLDPTKTTEDDSDTGNIKTLLDLNRKKKDDNEKANNFFKVVKRINKRNAIQDLASQ
jgi:hypothetical protein